ncbi:MAG: hypothetical protein ACLQNE_02645 [Thermoguttaceae bacterium]
MVFLTLLASLAVTSEIPAADVDASRLRGKVMCGYQGWFRCPGDAAGLGWVHWSRDRRRIAPETLSFEMWPDMAEYGAGERFPAPGFTYPDHGQAQLFSSDNPATVLRHFYPGFRWDNLTRQRPGASEIPRRKGRFLWEQFHELAKLGADTVYVAMFDEVDEETAIFKVTNSPPTQGHFLGYEGLPSDWYLRLAGEGIRMLRKQRPITREIPIRP